MPITGEPGDGGRAVVQNDYKICFFIGHRDAPDRLLPMLVAEVERHVAEYGVREFVVGHYGNFDALAGKAVKAVRERHPKVLLTRLLPYHPGGRNMKLPDDYNGSFYPPMEGVPRKFAIVRANRYMIDHSDYLIAYVWHPASNAIKLLEYAQKREKRGKLYISFIPR